MPVSRKFSELHQFKTPPGFAAAVSTAAMREFCTNAEFIRRAVLDRLRAAGVGIVSTASGHPSSDSADRRVDDSGCSR
jgi:hypothetical protein